LIALPDVITLPAANAPAELQTIKHVSKLFFILMSRLIKLLINWF